ncbi:uncharacterized protein LY89DRAFT_714359 [Mollisia scopiformis]|uniref:Uncharacterized protein n=1 Tax=Mollisia scopiformis TaxID=149040 RepID=A0A194XR12_MOLSC|nr:uncharacterized protein LY89DRAFT_714359 [Mollisia scopiformis]KUJ22591.1 hypothetical protein LY89DRAFT_714359 [Mollisia scopiformis]
MASRQRPPHEEDEVMAGGQPSQQQQKQKQTRRPTTSKIYRVMDDIMAQNVNDEASYALPSTSVAEQARLEPTFTGDAYYYLLNRKKVRSLIHVCIFTKPHRPSSRSEGHRNLNTLLDDTTNIYAVASLHFRTRNLTLWLTPSLDDQNTTSLSRAFTSPSPPSTSLTPPTGLLDARLAAGPASSHDAKVSFGAKKTRAIQDVATGYWIDRGFEFVSVEWPSWDAETGGVEGMVVTAVKIPEAGEVAGAFLLEQVLVAPVEGEGLMRWFEGAEEVVVPRKRRGGGAGRKVVIAPRVKGKEMEMGGKGGGGEDVVREGLDESLSLEERGSLGEVEGKGKGKEKEKMEVADVHEVMDLDGYKEVLKPAEAKEKGKEVGVMEIMDLDDISDAETIKD